MPLLFALLWALVAASILSATPVSEYTLPNQIIGTVRQPEHNRFIFRKSRMQIEALRKTCEKLRSPQRRYAGATKGVCSRLAETVSQRETASRLVKQLDARLTRLKTALLLTTASKETELASHLG